MQHVNVRGRFLLILVVILAAVWLYHRNGLKLAQDLRGGTSIRFSVDVAKAKAEGRVDSSLSDADVMAMTLKVIDDRINKSGLQEIELTDVGENKFEINLPASSDADTESLIELVTALGDLQFRIEVLPENRYPPFDQPNESGNKRVRRDLWKGDEASFEAFKASEIQRYREAEQAGRPYIPSQPPYRLVPLAKTAWRDRHPDGFALLEDPANEQERFDGGVLSSVTVGRGDKGQPVTLFDIQTEYQGAFERWTGANVNLPMAIVLNGQYHTAPTIQSPLGSRGVQVTLGTLDHEAAQRQAEQLRTTMQTGSLKVTPIYESKTKLGARLAGQARDRGILATVAALGLVILFMLLFYGRMGLVANVALVLNLVLLLGALAAFQSALSLPGIAGIVLTLGAAVDANILINERIREERQAGKSLHRAIGEGYHRALTTIVDANMTSIITAAFLYLYGTGSIRGFAVSLALGLLISMFTAVFVTRAIFEWQLARGSLKEVSGLKARRVPTVPWMALRRVLVPISVGLVLFGLGMFFGTDRYTLYDVDFTGGQKVQLGFSVPTSVDQVKARLQGGSENVEVVTIVRDEKDQNITRRRVVAAGPYGDAEVYAVASGANMVEIKVQRASEQGDLSVQEQAQALAGFLRKRFQDRLLPEWTTGLPVPYRAASAGAAPAPGSLLPAPSDPAAAASDPELATVDGGVTFDMSFVDPRGSLTADVVRGLLASELPHVRMVGPERRTLPAAQVSRAVVVRQSPISQPGVKTFQVWLKTTEKEAGAASGGTAGAAIDPEPETLRRFLGDWLGSKAFREALGRALGSPQAAEEVSRSAPFGSQDQISPSVAQRLRNDALIALLLSFLGIIVYVALRFHSRAMGIASVLCLFHDVAVTLGVVALANTLGLVDAKINLTMVAAFLTLVGFSINDTVVIYDRIREIRGERPVITASMIDDAVNQTLGRTFKTIATVLLVCVAMFAFNVGQRNVLEGFAFALIVGSFVGTYSTVAIASPLLLFLPWLWERIRGLAPAAGLITWCTRHPAFALVLPFAVVLWAAWGAVFLAVAFVVGLLLFVPWALSSKSPTQVAAG